MTRPTTAQLNAAYDQFNFWYDKAKKLDEELAKADERIAELEAQAAPPASAMQKDVEAVVGLLEPGEWAEHCTKTELGSRLESEITRLIGGQSPSGEVFGNSEHLEHVSKLNYPELPDGWIKCSERMPEDCNTVLVVQEGGIIYCAEVDGGVFYPDEFPKVPTQGKEITHWMPLPAAPEVGN